MKKLLMANEITKRKSTKPSAKKKGSTFKEEYERNLPALMSRNLRMQMRALEVIEEKIGEASAAQAATVYGILFDKARLIAGAEKEANKTFNMYFGNTIGKDDASALMERVLSRMKSGEDVGEVDTIDAEFKEVKDNQNSKNDTDESTDDADEPE